MNQASQQFISRALLNSAILTLLIASTCAGGIVLAGGNENASAEEPKSQARQLWEAAIAAKGGRERLRSISAFLSRRT